MEFDALRPDLVLDAIEQAFGIDLDGTITPYPSYINRVYGLRTDEGNDVVAKFYRPGRWSAEAVAEEHEFVLDCHASDVAVVAPLADEDGDTLHELEVPGQRYLFTLFPRMGGRNFDAERDEDWYRLGTLVARVHLAGRARRAQARDICHPEHVTEQYLQQILEADVIHPNLRNDFEGVCRRFIRRNAHVFDDEPYLRVHGDFHRGNILDHPDMGLVVIDFDDMLIGPAVQDIWLLLPDYAHLCRRELTLLLDGYEQFLPFPRRQLKLIEPLRFMRMIYFLAWQVRQRNDRSFYTAFPHWGTKAFWQREVEELHTQAAVVEEYAQASSFHG